MKQVSFVLILCIALAIQSFANGEKNTTSAVLRSATVYRAGAELTHTARLTLEQGNNELVIEGISSRIQVNSLQIGNDGNATLMSVEFSTNYLKPTQQSAITKKLEDSLDIIDKDLALLRTGIQTNNELMDLLKANKQIGGTQTGLSVAELTKMMDYYRTKTLELQKENNQLKEKETRLLENQSKISKQLKEEEQKNTKTGGKLLLQVFAPMAGTYNFTVSYLTPLASWMPAYDIRVENISKPVKLSYKAKLAQSTGFDWKQVKLTLATAMPTQNNNAPELKSWWLSYQDPFADLRQNQADKKKELSFNNAFDASPALEEVAVAGYGTIKIRGQASDQKDQEPLYIVNGKVVSNAAFKKIDPNNIKNFEVLKDAAATSIYGARAGSGAILVTLKGSLGDYVSVNDSELNVTFEIDLPYDVPSNGKEQNVALKDFTVPALYQYYTAPRVDKDAYLLSNIADWEGLNLLPGEANIIFEGTYIGKTNIDPNATTDTLNFTLGKDKRVVVTREKLKDFSSVKFLGSNKKQVFTYEITVKNNKKEKIQLQLKDQYPLSTNKDIEIELLEASGAANNAEQGLLTWSLEIAPGESKKVRLSYSVKYPKDKVINVH